jgi:hypothetical protein
MLHNLAPLLGGLVLIGQAALGCGLDFQGVSLCAVGGGDRRRSRRKNKNKIAGVCAYRGGASVSRFLPDALTPAVNRPVVTYSQASAPSSAARPSAPSDMTAVTKDTIAT